MNIPTLEQLKVDDKLLFDFVEFFFGIKLYSYQMRLIKKCLTEKRICGLFPRQSGKSQAIAVYVLLVSILGKEDIIIAAPTADQASLLYLKVVEMIEKNPDIRVLITRSVEEKTDFTTGSTIRNITVGPTGVTKRGHTCSILIEEEAQSIKDSINNTVLMPMLASKKDKGQTIKIGTSNVRNHFYNSCYKDTKYSLIEVGWEEVVKEGQYSLDFIEEQRLNLSDAEFQAEYCSKFIDDINAYFSIELIDSCAIEYDLIEIL